jgi:uncharacterized membrane protein (UPF0127 family)
VLLSLLPVLVIGELLFHSGSHAAEPAQLLREFGKSNLILQPANGPCVLLDVYIADKQDTRMQGLMFIEKLGEFEGMFFVYPQPVEISMWMKNTLIPLDMLFISHDGTISNIATDTIPLSTETIRSKQPVVNVLELNAGSVRRWNLRTGDRVR